MSNKKLRTFTVSDARQLYSTAETFRKTSQLLTQVYHFKEYYGDIDFLYALIGTINTNSALALEILLKCVHAIENGFYYEGHFLDEQFYRLSASAQQKIEQYYDVLIAQAPDVIHAKKHGLNIGNLDLKSAITEASNAFTEHRYQFEQGFTSYKGMFIANAVSQYLRGLNPSWPELVLIPPPKQ